jgi:predicted O-methyltransferase YrrM
MNKETWTKVDQYITDLFVPPDDALDHALRTSAAAGLPNINVSPNQGKLLMILAQIQGAKKVLEIGTLGGYSTIWLARGLPKGEGKIVTLEFEARHADVAEGNFERAGVADVVEIVRGAAIESLAKPAVQKHAPYDLIFIDADKPNNPGYFGWAMKLSRPGTLIIIDNVVRDGEVIDPKSKDPGVQGVRRMNEMIVKEKRVVATAFQTVGAKSYDGMAIVRVIG